MTELLIKVGNVNITATKDDLVEVTETADGINFVFKGGLTISFMNQYMQSNTKQIIKNTADHMSGKKITFTLDSPKNPILVNAN